MNELIKDIVKQIPEVHSMDDVERLRRQCFDALNQGAPKEEVKLIYDALGTLYAALSHIEFMTQAADLYVKRLKEVEM